MYTTSYIQLRHLLLYQYYITEPSISHKAEVLRKNGAKNMGNMGHFMCTLDQWSNMLPALQIRQKLTMSKRTHPTGQIRWCHVWWHRVRRSWSSRAILIRTRWWCWGTCNARMVISHRCHQLTSDILHFIIIMKGV